MSIIVWFKVCNIPRLLCWSNWSCSTTWRRGWRTTAGLVVLSTTISLSLERQWCLFSGLVNKNGGRSRSRRFIIVSLEDLVFNLVVWVVVCLGCWSYVSEGDCSTETAVTATSIRRQWQQLDTLNFSKSLEVLGQLICTYILRQIGN